jgi:hypothetical protein
VTGLIDLHEGKVSRSFELSSLLIVDHKALNLGLVEGLLSGPLESFSPGTVSEPVANVISVTGIDQDRDLLEEFDDKFVEWQHPVSIEEEVAIDVKVARLIRRNLGPERRYNILLVEILRDPAHFRVAKVVRIFTLPANVIDIQSGALIRADHSIVAVDGCRDTRPHRLGGIAVLDHTGTTRVGIVHILALRVAQGRWVPTFTTSHGAVVLVLGETIGKTVANENRLKVDVALLMRENLGGELRNIVSSIRFTSDMEVLLSIFREFIKEHGQERINVLSRSVGA